MSNESVDGFSALRIIIDFNVSRFRQRIIFISMFFYWYQDQWFIHILLIYKQDSELKWTICTPKSKIIFMNCTVESVANKIYHVIIIGVS